MVIVALDDGLRSMPYSSSSTRKHHTHSDESYVLYLMLLTDVMLLSVVGRFVVRKELISYVILYGRHSPL